MLLSFICGISVMITLSNRINRPNYIYSIAKGQPRSINLMTIGQYIHNSQTRRIHSNPKDYLSNQFILTVMPITRFVILYTHVKFHYDMICEAHLSAQLHFP